MLFAVVSAYTVTIFSYVAIVHQFPREWKKSPKLKKRLNSVIIALSLSSVLEILYLFIAKIMITCPEKFQWIVALLLPLYREFSIWLIFRCAKKASDGDLRKTEIVCNHTIGSGHAFALSYMLGSIATIETTGIILGIDFFINIFTCLKIIYLKMKRPDSIEKITGLLQELIINEMVEFVVPLAYIASVLVCYFGPNAKLIGNIGSNYWQYEPIHDLNHTVEFVLIFFFADLGSLLVSTILLWAFCRINLYRVYSTIQKEFGWIFTIELAVRLIAVRKQRTFI